MANLGRPTGRHDVRNSLIDAATRQFSAKGMSASMRDIADDAGVNIGLIHRHIGNKDDLLEAVLERQIRDAHTVLDGNDNAATLGALVEAMPHMTDYVRILAWRLLAGEHPAEIQATAPVLQALSDRSASDRELVDQLSGLALIYGWVVFGPQLLAGSGRSDIPWSTVVERVGELAVRLADPTQAPPP